MHGDEIAALRVRVALGADVARFCGGDTTVVACYSPDDERRLASGEMVLPYDRRDRTHALVHEYGHHVDNQLWNLTPLGLCGLSDDGSRRWFFARQVDDDVIRETGCDEGSAGTGFSGELFAEDFVALNGIGERSLAEIAPPSPAVLSALRRDVRRPLARGAGRASRERIRTRLLPAGAYEVGVSARRAAGAYRFLLELE